MSLLCADGYRAEFSKPEPKPPPERKGGKVVWRPPEVDACARCGRPSMEHSTTRTEAA